MKKYNVQNYIKYKEDLKKSILNLEGKFWDEYTRDELIVKFLPLVENIARKFSTTQQASGVLSINDLIQEGSIGLTAAVDRLDWNKLKESDDIEKTLKSFLSKRIKGAIRRAIDINRGDIKIPEHKLIEMRKNEGKDRKITEMFFNSVFSSIDEPIGDDEDSYYQVPDKSEPYNIDLLNIYLLGIMKTYLTVLDYANGTVYRFELRLDKWINNPEEFILEEGFNLGNIEWMTHTDGNIYTDAGKEYTI
jgi:DNA-directed RNA polymerase specialized sigma subunit